MGNYTANLGLYNTDMTTDGNDTFDFKRDLNDNNDILDSAIGKLSTLTTTDKSSLVNAINEIATDLNGKADVDFTNINNSAKGKIAYNAMPSSSYINLTLNASDSQYTAPADGFFVMYGAGVNTTPALAMVGFKNITTGLNYYNSAYTRSNFGLILPIKKNEIISCEYTNYGLFNADHYFRFYYAQGTESEAS